MDKNKIFKNIFIILFLAFIVSYVIELTGYYEYNLQKKTIMTNESIAKFEQDIADGKDVHEEDYVVTTEKDYTSSLTEGTNKLSAAFNKVLVKGIEGVFRIIGSLVED